MDFIRYKNTTKQLYKTSRTIGLLRKLQSLLWRVALITIYKTLLDLITTTVMLSMIKELTLHTMKN